MADYERMSPSEVQLLAKRGDKKALYEMAWRMELMPGNRNNPSESCAWQDFWFEKAANAGYIEAKSRYARSLADRIPYAEYRQKAVHYFQSIVEDFDAGRFGAEDDRLDGIISKFYLGIMLCEGYHTRRDPIKGVELIKSAGVLTNGFEGFGFRLMFALGQMYATGLAQAGEDPTIDDLEQAIKYLDIAVRRFNDGRDDPRRRDIAKQLIETQKDRIVHKREWKILHGAENTVFTGADERRADALRLSPEVRQRLDADNAALARLRERLAREGW